MVMKHIMNALGAVGNAADLPGSTARDLLAGKGLSGSFDQWLSPHTDANRTSGRDLLRRYGWAGKDNTWGNFAGGMAVEAVTDPLNFIGGGLLAKAAKAKAAAQTANRGIDAANAISQSQRASGFMPAEVIPKLHPSVLESPGVPKKFYHGGPDISFQQYDPQRLDPQALYGKGIYATDAPHVAGGEGGYWAKGLDKATKYEVPEPNRHAFEQAILNDSAGEAKYVPSAYKRLEAYGGNAMLPPAARTYVQATPPPAGVKAHYMDVRNPLDIDADYIGADIPIKQINETYRRNVQSLIDRARSSQMANDGDYAFHFRNAKRAFDDRVFRPSEMSGTEIYNALDGTPLPAAGYDGIVHKGGQNVGGMGDHNVAVAFNPSQMHLPYIAQELQQRKPVPRLTPQAMKLALYNALARQGAQRQ